MSRTPRLAALLTTSVLACTPAETPSRPVNIAPPPAASTTTVEERGADLVSVTPIAAPSAVVVDGDLAEWGAFPTDAETLQRPYSYREAIELDGPVEKVDPPKNPERAASRVAFALGGKEAWIVADLGPAASEGIWVGVGAEVADLPLLGQYFGRMGFVVLDCETKPVAVGEEGDVGYGTEERTPEEARECQSLKARVAERAAQHAARFERLFRVEPTGVRVAGPGGTLVAVEGAKVVWKAGREGAKVEVSLPLKALPRAAEAPIEKVRLAARLGASTPAIGLDQWMWFKLPSKVTFEPYGELRRHAIARAKDVGEFNAVGTGTFQQPRGVSYQPGDPMNIEVVPTGDLGEPDPKEIPLFERFTSLGDMQIVRAAAPHGLYSFSHEPWLAVLIKDQVKELVPLPGPPSSSVTRDGEIHVIAYDGHVWQNTPGTWAVFAFTADGARRKVPVEEVSGFDPNAGKRADDAPAIYWENTDTFTTKDGQGFGWRGTRGGKGFEATWQWDAASKSYKGTQRTAVVKKKTPAKKPAKPAAKKAATPAKDAGKKKP